MRRKRMKYKYNVWYMPTKKGMEIFGWEPKLISSHDNIEDAQMDAYLSDADEPSPDKNEYANYYIAKVQVRS
jgi:hypothetical protein